MHMLLSHYAFFKLLSEIKIHMQCRLFVLIMTVLKVAIDENTREGINIFLQTQKVNKKYGNFL